MLAAEEPFEAGGRKFTAGAFIVPDADRAKLEPSIKELGLSGVAVAAAPSVKTHDLDVPRIGYVHAWQRTQDEGWVRLAFDTFGVPYTYFADQKLQEGNLRAKYDVIVYPHVGGSPQSHVNGLPMTGAPLPYKKTAETPNLGVQDESDDIRGGMGLEGLANLAKFVQEGGTLIAEGSTAALFPSYGMVSGVTVEEPANLFVRGSILKATVRPTRRARSPTATRATRCRSTSVRRRCSRRAAFRRGFGGGGGGGAAQANSGRRHEHHAERGRRRRWRRWSRRSRTQPERPQADEAAAFRQMARNAGINLDETRPRVVLRFPTNPNDMLLSGSLVGGQALSGRAVVVDAPMGKGHVVMFATRPYWRWQTQGLYFLGFNSILNWNDLDAGKATAAEKTTEQP